MYPDTETCSSSVFLSMPFYCACLLVDVLNEGKKVNRIGVELSVSEVPTVNLMHIAPCFIVIVEE